MKEACNKDRDLNEAKGRNLEEMSGGGRHGGGLPLSMTFILLFLGLLSCFFIMMGRYQSEGHHIMGDGTGVELVADYRSLCDYARNYGLSEDEVLRSWRDMGVTSLAVEELNRDDLSQRGLARCLSSYELSDLQHQQRVPEGSDPDPACVYFLAKDNAMARQIFRGASLSLGQGRVSYWPHGKDSDLIVELKADMRQVAGMGLGIAPEQIKPLAAKYGFRIWARPWNSLAYDSASLSKVFSNIAQVSNIQGVIFGGLRNEALGYPQNLEHVAGLLEKYNLKLGVIELAAPVQQKGIQTLGRLEAGKVVRVLAVAPAHQAKLPPESVASMYSLGARERNMRLLYLRPYNDMVDEMSPQEATSSMLSVLRFSLAGRLAPEAAVFGATSGPYVLPARSSSLVGAGLSLKLKFCWFGLCLALLAASLRLLQRLCPLSASRSRLLLTLGGAVCAACIFSGIGWRYLRLILAWSTLTVFPVWGLVLLQPVWEKGRNRRSFTVLLGRGWQALLIATLFSLAGGLMAASYLPDLSFMLSLDVFRGIKLHGALVPLAVLAVWIYRQRNCEGLQNFVRLMRRNVKFWHLLAFLILAGLAAFYLVRTGNDGGDVVVSEGERALRRWLDAMLGVRPRFKEFILGAPALILLPLFCRRRWNLLIPLAVLAAAVGQASVSDTYAHLHTPLGVSMIRTFLGVVTGGCLGSVLFAFLYPLHRSVEEQELNE